MRLSGILLALGALLLLPACAHAQGAALMKKPITAGNCPSLSAPNLVGDSGVHCALGQISTTDTVNGGSVMLAPNNLLAPTSPALLNNTPGHPLYFLRGVPSTGTDAGDFECRRDANYTGGTFGFVNPCIYSQTFVSAGTKSFEWSLLARLDNNGVAADASQNVAAYFQGRKLSTGFTWGAVTELLDYAADPIASSVTDEHDMDATGSDVHGMRVLFDGWLRNVSGTAPVAATYAIRLNTDTGGTWGHGLYFNGSYGDGLNLSNATFSGGAIVLAAGQKLYLNGAGGNFYLTYNGSTNVLQVFSGATAVLGINATSGVVSVGASSSFGVGLLTGVTCSGVTAATVTVNGGIVTHC